MPLVWISVSPFFLYSTVLTGVSISDFVSMALYPFPAAIIQSVRILNLIFDRIGVRSFVDLDFDGRFINDLLFFYNQ